MSKKPADRTPAAKRTRSNTATRTFDQTHGARDELAPNTAYVKMPHERDESAGASGDRDDHEQPASRRQITQAHKDVERGMVDTDRRGTPNDVPTRGHK